jgi:type II secretory pathway pseudopilin PulG
MSTIFKVLIHNSIKLRNSYNGFTLLELLIGLVLMSAIGGLAMNAFVETSKSFRQDKKEIDTSQNLSAILEIIGNDIRQAGENINDGSFPAIEFTVATAAESAPANGLVPGSSKIIVRRAVSTPMTLCQTINANTITTTALATAPTTAVAPLGTITVADNAISATTPNCAVGWQTSPLFAIRPNATFVPNTTPATAPLPSPPTGASGTLTLVLPDALRQARDYRCEQVDPNPVLAYSSPAQPSNADFCPTTGIPPSVRVAISDGSGHMLIFNQTAESDQSPGNYNRYGLQYNATFVTPDPAIANNNNAAANSYAFGAGNSIYPIEERVYTLVKDPTDAANLSGILYLSKNGATPVPLIKGITTFNIAARGYTDALLQVVNPTPAGPTVNPNPTQNALTAASPICLDSPTFGAATVANPQYVCKFNYSTAADPAINWKQIAGVRVSLQAKYDGAGQSATVGANDKDANQLNIRDKLKATAEYFPRNVLSK